MSAYVVQKELIDGLLTYALDPARTRLGALRWTDPAFYAHSEHEHAYASGQPWGDLEVWKHYSRELTRETANRVGAMLWAENVRSVNHRYAEDEWEEIYEYERRFTQLTPTQVFAGISCYEYQSCEHPEWRTSEAHEFCQALKEMAIRHLPSKGDDMWWIEKAGA